MLIVFATPAGLLSGIGIGAEKLSQYKTEVGSTYGAGVTAGWAMIKGKYTTSEAVGVMVGVGVTVAVGVPVGVSVSVGVTVTVEVISVVGSVCRSLVAVGVAVGVPVGVGDGVSVYVG